jgi:tRNA(Ile)-lysidine synthase
MIPAGARVMAGVSGGADSVAMLYALHYLQKSMRFSLSVAHLHHGMRGSGADRDQDFVRQLAWKLRLPVYTDRCDVPAAAAASGLSPEMAARQARQAFFAALCSRMGADCVAVAHTLDDQAETMLMRICRGAGLRGLCGISYANPVRELRMIRPLRDVTHEQARAFLCNHGLVWREDAGNRDMRYVRNRIRHIVMPVLREQVNPAVREAVCRLGMLAAEDEAVLQELACRRYRSIRRRLPEAALLPLASVRGIAPALLRRILMCWLEQAGADLSHIGFRHLRQLGAMAADREGGAVCILPGDWEVRHEYDQLHLLRRGRERGPVPFSHTLRVPGQTVVPEAALVVTCRWSRGIVRDRRSAIGRFPAVATLNGSRCRENSITVRNRRPGDRMAPMGMRGTRKLQDIFVDAKVPVRLRRVLPVFTSGPEIIWLPGYRVARGWEVPAPDAECLKIRVRRMKG